MGQLVVSSMNEGVYKVVLNRPEVKNALSSELLAAFDETLRCAEGCKSSEDHHDHGRGGKLRRRRRRP